MKKLYFLLCVLLLGAGYGFSGDEAIPWNVFNHPFDTDVLEDQINEFVNEGYTPLGISYIDDELYILYVGGNAIEFSEWSLMWYESTDTLEEGITEYMNEGFFPVGISYIGEVFFILYLQTENNATAWQLVPSEPDFKAIEKVLAPWTKKNYLPVGITLYDDTYWILLVQIENTTAKAWSIEGYSSNEEIVEGIDSNLSDGIFPWGYMYREDIVNVLYLND